MENERIYIYKNAEALAESVGSLYRDTGKCRDDLLNFFIVNKWFGQTLEGNGDDIYIRNSTEITERLSLWLMAYRRTDSEKTDILIERFSERYPITCAEFRKYFKEAGTRLSPVRNRPGINRLYGGRSPGDHSKCLWLPCHIEL